MPNISIFKEMYLYLSIQWESSPQNHWIRVLKVFKNPDICVTRYFLASNSKFSSSGALLSSRDFPPPAG